MAGTDFTWQIDTQRDDGGIVANSGETEVPTYTRGEEIEITFRFWDEPARIGATGGTFGGPNGMTFGGDAGATFGAGSLPDHIQRYLEARQYLAYAGAATVQMSINGVPHFAERLPEASPVDTITVPFEPGDGLQVTDGIWGIIMGGEDRTRFPDDVCILDFQIVVLGTTDEFRDRDELEDELGAEILEDRNSD